MRAANSCPRHRRVLRRRSRAPGYLLYLYVGTVIRYTPLQQILGGKTGSRVSPTRYIFVLPSGIPTLVNGPATGSTHPLSVAYHRCCCTPPGLLTNNMNFCRLFLFPVLFPFNFNSISLSLSIFHYHSPSLHPKFRHLKSPSTGTL